MRTRIVRTLSVLLCVAAAFLCASPDLAAQILVGPSGSAVFTFTNQPTVADGWSTLTVGDAANTYGSAGAVDSAVNNTTASAVTTALGSSSTQPPSANNIARRNTAAVGLYLQTRPTGNDYLLLMATLRNNTGSNIASAIISYDFGIAVAPDEEVPGHRAFYSLTGLPGSWQPIAALSGVLNAGTLTATVPVVWQNSSNLYLLWADDNADGGTEAAYTIDNFSVKAVPSTSPPIIAIHPQDQSALVGGSATFSVTVSPVSATPLSYFWRKNTAPNTILSIGPTLVLNNASLAQEGLYSVIVSNRYGTATSSNAEFSVGCKVPATIATQPVDRTLNSGQTLSLIAGAIGTSPITYQWYRNGTPILNATNANYTKLNAAGTNSGFYYVVASNCGGSQASEQVVVSVADRPFVIMPLTTWDWRYDQSGADLGSAWRATNYNDSAWPSGRGVFAWETLAAITSVTNTVLSLSNGTTRVRTFYFRTAFEFTNDPALVQLVSSNYIDDGAVFYLNGAELFRVNMSGGAVLYNTFAPGAGPATEGTYYVTNIPTSLLLQGTNYLAVEMHQNSDTSTDIAFGMALHVVPLAPSPLAITNDLPSTLRVEETKTVNLELGLSGAPAYFQWYKNGLPMSSNGTANPLVFSVASTNDSGTYFVIATNSINAVTSSIVALTVFPDTNAPTLVEADGSQSLTTILVSFSELIRVTEATNRPNYRVTNTIGTSTLTINSAVLTNGTNVLLTTSARNANENYILVVNNVRDVSPALNTIAANSSIPVSTLITVIPLVGGAYTFHDPVNVAYGDQPDQGTAWRNPGFVEDGNLWFPGGTPFFYNGAGEYEAPFPLDPNSPLSQSLYLITYFRNTFETMASPGGVRLELRHFVDDGAVFYLNGTEVLRHNMKTGPIGWTNASLTRTEYASLTDPIQLDVSALRSNNLFAVELHQWSNIDTDKVFAAEVRIRAQSLITGPVVITRGPQDKTVIEGQSVTFNVEQAGGRDFRWQQNNNNISGATNATYTIASVPLSLNNATYRVVVSNSVNSVTSSIATLRVVQDTNGPIVVGASLSLNAITVKFSESVTPATATALANYVVTNKFGNTVTPTSATLTNGTNVVLRFNSLPFTQYFVKVSNIRDTQVLNNLMSVNPTLVRVGFDQTVVAMGGTWRYDDSYTDRGTDWIAPSYVDSSWDLGLGVFQGARGTPPLYPDALQTTLTLSNANNTAQIPTYYFRAHFNSMGAPSAVLTMRTLIDDGAIVYLNGKEVTRLGMPSTTVTFNTLASRSVTDGIYEGPFFFTITNLIDGDNVIAVEVHQTSLTSSDITWAGDFSVFIPSVVNAATNVACVPLPVAAPKLNFVRQSSNLVQFSWQNPVNSCGSNTVFMLQQSLGLSNVPSATVWSTVTSISPTNIVTTNSQRYFRLQQAP